MTRLTRRALLVVFAATAVAGCGADESANAPAESSERELFDQRITFQQVLQRLRDDDEGRVSRTIAQLDPMIGRAKVRTLLLALWEGDRESFPDLNWPVLERQRVRIAVARVLGSQESTELRYRDYVLRMSEQATVMSDRCEALVALGAIGRAEDLVRLQSIAVGSNTLLATAAMAGLFASNKKEALQAVEAISMDPAIPQERRRFAVELLALPRPPE
jgi:hypothetical protein